jgi:hypothetical protein
MIARLQLNRRFTLGLMLLTIAGVLLWVAGCAGNPSAGNRNAVQTARVQAVDLNNLVSPQITPNPVSLSAAKNEWASFQVQVSGLPIPSEKVAFTLRLAPLNLRSANRSIAVQNFSIYQILSMPVDVNRAGYVRHTGLTAATHSLPRALLPLPSNDGKLNLATARDPSKPTDPQSRAGASPVMLWVDLHIPPEAPAGSYSGTCDILQTGVDQPIASLPVNLNVYDFVLPAERHLTLAGQIDWESFTRLYPNRFEAVTPRLIHRGDPKYDAAVKTFDQLVTMAQAHRVEITIPRLQPTVKWPGGRPPLVTWDDFDSVVAPWLRGDVFPDKVGLDYWPLPECEGYSTLDPGSQVQYVRDAATHFDQNDWLTRAPVFIDKQTPGRATSIEAVRLSSEAAAVLSAHPRVRVQVPLEDDQVQFGDSSQPNLIRTDDSTRLITSNPGIVFSTPIRAWPSGIERPPRWLRTDLTGLVPYFGAGGDERDVRLWAWLSFLPLPPPPPNQLGVQYGPVQTIRWAGVLPRGNSPTEPADPNELVWFYPGEWFGVDQPVPTIQLKWLRRAQQDFEYLYLARQRGDTINALWIARLMTKPVELAANQEADQTYGLLSGTADPKAWDQALDLLSKRILLREPGQPVDPDKDVLLNREMLAWSETLERPMIMGHSTYWAWDSSQNNGNWIDLRLGIDIYNASDNRPDQNLLSWSFMPPQTGWQYRPQPVQIPALATYHVGRYSVGAELDPTKLRRVEHRPVQVTFTNGYNNKQTPLTLVLPVGNTDRREAGLQIDGSLNDWSADDAIQDGPMVKMFNRPALQAGELQSATNPAQVFTTWSEDNFYVAFKLAGISQSAAKTVHNDVIFPFRRAWGEDLCQILVQAVYADNTRGPVLHVICKPSGATWVERKTDSRTSTDPWEPYVGDVVRYWATINPPDWRGEVAIPWKALNSPDKRLPVMLRFNFVQHVQETGESSSWAGPVDFGRDDAFTGVLVLREPQTPGMRQP